MPITDRPQQKTMSKSKEWYANNADYHIAQCNWMSVSKTEMDDLFRARDGILTKQMYRHVLNPYNTEKQEYLSFPADLRNYDIIKPVVETFMGEKASQFPNPMVVCMNDDAPNKLKIYLKQQEQAYLAQMFVNELNEQGMEGGPPTKEVPEDIPAEIKKIELNWDDTRAIVGQEALNYLVYDLELRDTHQELFDDWLTLGRFTTYKDVYRDDITYERIDPRQIWSSGSDTHFIEDGEWVVRQLRLSIPQVIDRFREELEPKQIDTLEQRYHGLIRRDPRQKVIIPETGDSVAYVQGLVEVYHIVWKAYRRIGIVTYYDPLTEEETEMEVPDDYHADVVNGDIRIRYEWINEVHEVYRIGEKSLDMYVRGRAIPVQRNEISNTSICKLPYNGRYDDSDLGGLKSVVKQGLTYQVLFNTIHYRAELILAKNKDKVMLMPIGLKPKEWDTDKWLYEMDTTNIAWFNEVADNAPAVMQALKAIDMSLGNYVEQVYNILDRIKAEWWDSIGINRQRMSDVRERDGKANTEQAIFRSSVITAELFRKFDKTIERDYNGILDYSKVAFSKGKKGAYITSDQRKAFIDVNGTEYMESDLGCFVKDTIKEAERLEAMKMNAQAMLQNGVSAGAVADVVDADNVSAVKRILTDADKAQKEYEQSLEQSKVEAQQQMIAMTDEASEKQLGRDLILEEKKTEGKVEVALINQQGSLASAQLTADSKPDPLVPDATTTGNNNALEERKQAGEELKHNNEMVSKERDRKSNEKIAKENKNQYDTKK